MRTVFEAVKAYNSNGFRLQIILRSVEKFVDLLSLPKIDNENRAGGQPGMQS
jgi:hypothetical protein